MGNILKWIVGLFGAYMMLQPDKQKPIVVSPPKSDSSNPHSFFAFPVNPLSIRNDAMGQGHFGARRRKRKDGQLVYYPHRGLDLESQFKYQPVYSPIRGEMTRIAYPYINDKRWEGCEIIGSGEHLGYSIKMFYMKPLQIPMDVGKGQQIGEMQDIGEKWKGGMKAHLHVEVRKLGELIDPALFFPVGEQA